MGNNEKLFFSQWNSSGCSVEYNYLNAIQVKVSVNFDTKK